MKGKSRRRKGRSMMTDLSLTASVMTMMIMRTWRIRRMTDLSPMARVMTTDSRMLSCQPRSSRIPTVTTKKINGKAKTYQYNKL